MVDLTGYKLTFDDEFNTRSISSNGATTWHDARDEWRMPDGKAETGFGNSSFMDPSSGYDPFSVKDGTLTITAAPPGTTSAGVPGSWQSGLITTQDSFSQKYGYFEMRAEVSNSPGGWDGYWMLPTQQSPAQGNSGSWQELDAVEHLGSNPGTVYSFDHTTAAPNAPYGQVITDQNTTGYHTYGVKWTPDKLDFYFDGQLTGSQDTPADYTNSMYMAADLAIKDGTVAVGQNMKIDYIRAYSNDGSNPTVAQDTVSAPDNKDPGMYGATALNSQPPATNSDPVTQPPVTNPPSATASTNSTATATSTAGATGSVTRANDMVNTASTDSTDVASQSSGSTGPTVGTANTTASSASTSNPVSTAGASASPASALDGPQSASGPAAGSIATDGTTTSTDATGAVQQAATVETSSSLNSVSATNSTTGSTGPATSTAGADTSSTTPAGSVNPTDSTNAVTSTGTPAPASTAASDAISSVSTSSAGKTYGYQTFSVTENDRKAAIAMMEKASQSSGGQPTPTGSAHSFSDAMFHFY